MCTMRSQSDSITQANFSCKKQLDFTFGDLLYVSEPPLSNTFPPQALTMNTYMIGYDLNRPGQDYANLIEAIKKIGSWWHCLDSTWLVKSDATAVQIRDYLAPHIDQTDELLVADVGRAAAWIGLCEECSSWLHNNL